MAYNFDDASSEFFSIDASPVTAVPWAVSMWVQADDNNPAGDQYFFYYGLSSSASTWWSINFNSSGQINAWCRSGGAIVTSTPDYADGEWHHVLMAVYGSTTLELWVDGVSEGTSGLGAHGLATFDRVAIGMLRDSSPSAPFDGKVAELAMYGSTLGLVHARIFADAYSPLFVDSPGRVSHWPLIHDTNDRHGVATFDTTGGTPDVADHPRIKYPAPQVFTPFAAAVGAAEVVRERTFSRGLSRGFSRGVA